MNPTAIFWPMLAHVALVYGIYGLLVLRRTEAAKAGKVDRDTFRLNRDEPLESLFVRNNLASQFELPVLFYAACLTLHLVGAAGSFAVAVAWIFTLSRLGHAAVQVTSNRLRFRLAAFIVGFVAVAILWVRLALRLAGVI